MPDIKTTVNPRTLSVGNKPLLMNALRGLGAPVPIVRNKSRVRARPEVAQKDFAPVRTIKVVNNNNNKQDAGIGEAWENKDLDQRGYVPSMLRRSNLQGFFKRFPLNFIKGYTDTVTQESLDRVREDQSESAATHFWPIGSTPYNTLQKAYKRFGAENQDYYRKNGVIPPVDMKRNWTPEEQRLLDHMTPEDREWAESEANNIVKNINQPANYKHASFRAALKDHFTKRANGNLPYQKTAAEKHAFIQGLLQKHAGCSSSKGRKQTVKKCNTQGQCKSAAQILWDSLTRKN